VQTLSGAPASIHCGPFGNVAHGTASIISILMALKMNEYVVNEAGFGTDLGLEKFVNIVCRRYGLVPAVVVVVASCRALRQHGGLPFEKCKVADLGALKAGVSNLDAHINIVKAFGLKPVIAINKFSADSDEELKWLLDHCNTLGVPAAISEVYEKGADGGIELARKVIEAAECGGGRDPKLVYTYNLDDPVKEKIAKVATRVYGAAEVVYSADAARAIQQIEARDGARFFPICMAKTQASLSDDPLKLGTPKGFTLTVDEVRIYTGAEFVVPVCGGVLLMPGLPDVPAAESMDIDDDENITGLF
jgi:formate--tetrahydrofolate ligase